MSDQSLDTTENIDVVDNAENGFFELLVDGERAGVLVYSTHGSRQVITHSAIASEYQGRGLADLLIRTALDDFRGKQATVTNFCPAVDHFLTTHHEYDDMIDRSHSGLWAR
jgi:uncharacterized protein